MRSFGPLGLGCWNLMRHHPMATASKVSRLLLSGFCQGQGQASSYRAGFLSARGHASSAAGLLKVDLDGAGIKTVTMSSPRTRNVLSLEMLQQLSGEIAACSNNDSVRCVVIKGEGNAFSAGHNLKEMTVAEGSEYHARIFEECNRLMGTIVNCPVPVIAAVDGVAAAAGCQLVAICDVAVATEGSSFSVPGSGVGLFCSTPGVPLARVVPRKLSAYMLFTGKPINAREALMGGLVSRLAVSLDEEVKDVCDAIVAKPRAVVALGKKFYYEQLEMGLVEALDAGGKVMVDNLRYRDAQEGISSFIEKRRPVWDHTDDKVS